MGLPEWWVENWGNKPYAITDCLQAMKLIPDKSIDLVLTDIPYNISQTSNGLRNLEYGIWDHQAGMETKWTYSIIKVCKGTAIVFCGKKQFSEILNLFENEGFITRTLVWHKPSPTVLNCDKLYIEATELMVYAKRPGATYNPDYKHNVFEYVSPTDREHPCQKPLKLLEELIKDTTEVDGIVFDPFLGSGTTLLACRRTNRIGCGFEIEPKYEEVIRRRYMADVPDIETFGTKDKSC